MPVLVIHGDRDAIVPIRLGRRLFEAAPEPKEWYEIRGAATTIPIWWAVQPISEKSGM